MSSKKENSDAHLSTEAVDEIALPFIRTAYDGSKIAASDLSALKFDPDIEPSMTKQSFVAECDINTILKNFNKTGILTHINDKSPQYVDMALLPSDYHAACNLVFEAHEFFLNLPAELRDRFDNDPEKLLQFVSDDKNYEEAIKLGLVPPRPAPEGNAEAPASPPAGGDPQRPQTAGGGSSPASA